MSRPAIPCPGCGSQPFLDQHEDETTGRLECNNCSFSADANDWQVRTPGPATAAMRDHLAKELAFVSLGFRDATIPPKAGYRLTTKIPTDDVQAFLDEHKPTGAPGCPR